MAHLLNPTNPENVLRKLFDERAARVGRIFHCAIFTEDFLWCNLGRLLIFTVQPLQRSLCFTTFTEDFCDAAFQQMAFAFDG